jgi:hypothetical protein
MELCADCGSKFRPATKSNQSSLPVADSSSTRLLDNDLATRNSLEIVSQLFLVVPRHVWQAWREAVAVFRVALELFDPIVERDAATRLVEYANRRLPRATDFSPAFQISANRAVMREKMSRQSVINFTRYESLD